MRRAQSDKKLQKGGKALPPLKSPSQLLGVENPYLAHSTSLNELASLVGSKSSTWLQTPPPGSSNEAAPPVLPQKAAAAKRAEKQAAANRVPPTLDEALAAAGVPTEPTGMLELQAFDDKALATRLPTEWMELGYDKEGKFLPLLAKAVYHVTGTWQRCVVHSYSEKANTYEIEWLDLKPGTPRENPPPIEVFIEGDSQVAFAKRVAAAHQRRAWAEGLVRFHLYVGSMPVDRLPTLDETFPAEKLVAKACAGFELTPALEPEAEALIAETRKDFLLVENEVIFKRQLADASDSMLEGLDLPPAPSAVAPYLGVKVLPYHDFRAHFWAFCHKTLRLRPEAITVGRIVRQMCLDIAETEVYAYDLAKPLSLDEYKKAQAAKLKEASYVKDKWMPDLRQAILKAIDDGPEDEGRNAWFNLNETDVGRYQAGKLKKLVDLVGLMVADTLRSLLQQNTEKFAKSFKDRVPQTVKVENLLDFENCFPKEGFLELVREGELAVEPIPHDQLRPIFTVVLQVIEQVEEQMPHSARSTDSQRRPSKSAESRRGSKDVSRRPSVDKKSAEDVVKGVGKMLSSTGAKKRLGRSASKEMFDAQNPPKFKWDTSIPRIEKAVSEVFDTGLAIFDGIPSLPSTILPHLLKYEPQSTGVSNEESWVIQRRDICTTCVSQHQFPWFDDVMSKLHQFDDIVNMDTAAVVAKLQAMDPPPALLSLQKDLKAVAERIEQVQKALPISPLVLGFFHVDMTQARTKLMGVLETHKAGILGFIASRLNNSLVEATAAFDGIFKDLDKGVDKIEDVTEMREYISQVPSGLVKLQEEVDENVAVCEMVEQYGYRLPDDVRDSRWNMFAAPGSVGKKCEAKIRELDKETENYNAEQSKEQDEFELTITELETRVTTFRAYSDLGAVVEISKQARELQAGLQEAQAQAKLFNARETLFGADQSDYSRVGVAMKEFEPFYNLWKTAGDWVSNKDRWLNGNFGEIDASYCETEVTNGAKLMFKTIRAFRDDPEMKSICAIAEQIRTELEAFKPNVPIVLALRNAGMRDRHWDQLSQVMEKKIHPDESEFKLQAFLNSGMIAKLEQVEIIGDRAGKEFSLEKQLKKMKAEWEPVEFDLSEKYRTTGTYILKGSEEAMAILDEHTVMAQAMQFSIFKKPFEEEIEEWCTRLFTVSETLEWWLKVMRSWMYLQPIFESDDIIKQIPVEAKRFKQVDQAWRKNMELAKHTPKVIDICATEGLAKLWRECNDTLDLVQKGLEDYLETKRNAFARFYFLANEELLEILSQTKDPTRVQPFLSKVFEAIGKVTFTENYEVADMISPEGEVVPFVDNVVTKDANVEAWMGSLENEMREAVREAMALAIADYEHMERTEWVLTHTAQCVLNASQVYWTLEVQDAFKDQAIDDCAEMLQKQVLDLVALVRTGVSKLQRTTIGALVVLDVHAKDVVCNLGQAGITQVTAFEWISQLRYFWEEVVPGSERSDLNIKCVQTQFPYGYEYLGNSFRLVITPLTDLCYITLMGAMSLNLGGAPAGPANREDRDYEGLGEGARKAVRGVQLQSGDGLPHGWEVLQGIGVLRCVVLFRRVQPHQYRGALCDRTAAPRPLQREGELVELLRDEGDGV
jgi:dynein heavy chain